ncbi:MAG TPA: M48 family metallopeptidase [Gemmataceae bacterium]|nr:M48 family metallopeptidase [Gemmataceae bacterium]
MRLIVWILRAILLAGSLGAFEMAAAEDSTSTAQSATVAAAAMPADYVEVPPPTETALRYYHSGNLLWAINTAWGIGIPCLLLFTGLSARMRSWAQQLGRNWFFTIALYFVILWLLLFVINWPLNYFEGFVRPHEYGLSNQSFGKWLGDSLKILLVGLVAGSLFLWVPYFLLAKSPRRWWLYTGLLTVPFLFFVLFITPIWIEPLFNQFGPMKDKALEARILALAERAGIDGSRVFEVDKSVDTNAVNAYVNGFLGTKRIVLWDTLLQKLTDREILFIMGHEMGHFVLHHLLQGVLFTSLLVLVTLFAVHACAGPLIRRYRLRWGVDQLADVASLPLIFLLINVFMLVVLPVGLAFSRHIEHEADRFGLEITQDNHAAALSFVRLQAENLGVPRPGFLYCLWRCSHPSLGERVDFCNAYRPWEKGEPLKYGSLFREPR